MPPKYAAQVLNTLEALASLANPPIAANVRKLRGPGSFHRLRTGSFRAVFKVQGSQVRVIRVFDRKDMDRILTSIWS